MQCSLICPSELQLIHPVNGQVQSLEVELFSVGKVYFPRVLD